MDIADQGAIQKCLRLQPEIVPALAFAFGVGNESGDELQNVFFTMNVRERIIVERLLEIDGVQYLDTIAIAL